MLHLDTGLGTHFGELGQVPQLAREAEATGFGAIWAPETKHDPFLPLALVAEHTSRIRFGTAVAIAFPRSPMAFANIGWDLANFSGGRFILGLGTQVKGHNVGSSQSRHLSGLTSLHIFRPSQGQPGLANLIITIE